jgi:hypothetical protein
MRRRDRDIALARAVRSEQRWVQTEGDASTAQGLALQRVCMPPLTAALANHVPRGSYDRALWTQLQKIGDNGKISRAILTGAIVIDAARKTRADPYSLRSVCRRIGHALENECYFAGLYALDAVAARQIRRDADTVRGGLQARRKAGRKGGAACGYHQDNWGPVARARAGGWGVQVLLEHLPGFFEKRLVRAGKHREWRIEVTARGREIFAAAFAELVRDNQHVTPPRSSRPWTAFRCGGFWDRSIPLVSRGGIPTAQEFQDAIDGEQMRPALDALDYLQAVPFRTNVPIFRFVRWAWGQGCKLDGLPQRGGAGFWGDKSVFEVNLATADEMQTQGRFVCPSYFDFRGRIFPATQLNIQGNAAVRSLFLFADGEEVGEAGAAQALPWLRQYVVSCWGRLGDRRAGELTYVEKVTDAEWAGHVAQFAAWAAAAVLDARQWPMLVARLEQERVKSPFLFLAACLELAQLNSVFASGRYVARLPIFLDFTASGPQHFCLLARDEKGGELVNLVPRDRPRDLYTEAGKAILPELKRTAAARAPVLQYGADLRVLARSILDHAWFERQWTKPVLMPWGYDITEHGATDALLSAGVDFKEALYLRDLLFTAVPRLLPRAAAVKAWLRRASRVMSKAGGHLRWVAPDGFPMTNRYHKPDVVDIDLFAHRRPYSYRETVGDLPAIDAKRAADAAAANTVHAIDAVVARDVARAARGVKVPLATLHDCFATNAARSGWLHGKVLQLLAEFHEQHDVLAEIAKLSGLKLPRRPRKGKLDVSLVPTCKYALLS